ncbi:MAG: hypothetical protein GY839_16205 [candidate division Zixibacteria bacterium]|nr:hypothetical protein [candidate division Zixibacteria bacterium]
MPNNKSAIRNWLLIVLVASLVANIHLIYRALDYRRGANEWLDKYTNVVDEFSGRSRFAEENKRLKTGSTVNNRVVFLGTQVVDGWDIGGEFDGYEIIKRGVIGQWSAGMLLRFNQDVVLLQPEAVVIEISSYNLRPQHSVEEIQEYVSSMVDIAKANNIVPILATMIPLMEPLDKFGEYSVRDNINIYNRWLVEYCDNQNIRYVDFNAMMSNDNGFLRADLSRGPIDPNTEGYRLMSKSIRNVLDEL